MTFCPSIDVEEKKMERSRAYSFCADQQNVLMFQFVHLLSKLEPNQRTVELKGSKKDSRVNLS